MFDNIPLELKTFAHWVLWRFEDCEAPKPTKVPYQINGYHADPIKPNTWCSYDKAVHALNTIPGYNGIGFVLSDDDPYCIIDLDEAKDHASMERQMKVFNEFESYSERSPSGNGLHIIIRGSIPSGRKRSGIEIYSSTRYMTMTGDVYRDLPIKDYNDLANALHKQMGSVKNKAVEVYLGSVKETERDEVIIDRAIKAENGEKFYDLLNGNWMNYYPSQSEADLALIDIIAFYTQSRNQIVRIFKNSALGKRKKADRVDYMDYMLNKCFDRMLPPVDIDGLRNQLNDMLAEKARKNSAPANIQENSIQQPSVTYRQNIYSKPPGLLGAIAEFIYEQAPRPVEEIAIAGAIGLMSGIVGRAFNVSNTGLNQYTLLLAPTGTGKEAIASGIDKIFNEAVQTVPQAVQFVGPSEIASSQAIIKYMSRGPNSFVSLVGEFGIYLQQMASQNAPPHLIGLRRFLLDAYNKSGEGKILRPSIYSDKEKNTHAIVSPAFSILGESTPEKFYEGLHEGLISEGLLPRFTIIEYHGQRPPLNPKHHLARPNFDLVEQISTLCAHALMLNSQDKTIQVKFDQYSKKMFDEFDKYCDMQINAADAEVKRHLWNRGHMKALKLAGLVAIGNGPYEPVITGEVANWALQIVNEDTENLLKKFELGDIGIDNDEGKQLAKIAAGIKDFIVLPWHEVKKYAIGHAQLHSDKIIPYAYLQRKYVAQALFRKDRIGSSAAIKRALNTLVERGDLQLVPRMELLKNYNTGAAAYVVKNTKAFDF